MKHPVIAIGLDGVDPSLLEKWMSQGHLPNISRLREQGVYTRLETSNYYISEAAWPTLLSGCLPQQTGHWTTVKYNPNTYDVKQSPLYSSTEYPPFYTMAERRVAIFDVPKVTFFGVNGIQVLGWGSRANINKAHLSEPASLFQELVDRYGEFPLHQEDVNVLDLAALDRLEKNLKTAVSRRTAICLDLLQREPWDLFLTVFSETHYAAHSLWHLSQPDHPLHQTLGKRFKSDVLLEVFQSVDEAIGKILSSVPKQAHIVLFTDCSTSANVTDVPSMMLLPEFMYRFNFPGKCGIASGKAGTKPKPPLTGTLAKRGWLGMAWKLKHETNPLKRFLRPKLPNTLFNLLEPCFGVSKQLDLLSPFELQLQSHPLHYQPAVWYKLFWSQMKAFALPSFSDGRIRINLQGRDACGIVPRSHYDALCDQLEQKLYQLTDARTGKPLVEKVLRTRSPSDDNHKLPDADLVVTWQDEQVTDVVDSPEFGRIGPVPFFRTGGHRPGGFLLAQGPKIPAGTSLPGGHSIDIAPTILQLMDTPIPEYYKGKPLVTLS